MKFGDVREIIPGSSFWLYTLAGFAGLAIISFSILAIFNKRMKPYIEGIAALKRIHDYKEARRGIHFFEIHRGHFCTLNDSEKSSTQTLLEKVIKTDDMFYIKAIVTLAGGSYLRFILTLRSTYKLTLLKSKLENYSQNKPFPPFNFMELNALDHAKTSAQFWEDISDCFKANRHLPEEGLILGSINECILVLKDIQRLSENIPDLKTKLETASRELFKGAHFAIQDFRPVHEFMESEKGIIAQQFAPSYYTSVSVINYDSEKTRMFHMGNPEFTSETLSVEKACQYIPFKVDLAALVPSGLSSEQIEKLQSLFNENFQERSMNNEKLKEHMTYSLSSVIKSRFVPNWFGRKQSFRQDPSLGDPEINICSTLIAKDLWKSLQVVDCQLEMWGYNEPLKNPFGDYPRLNTMLPVDIVDCGVKHGWLTRVRDPEAEKLIQAPKTPTGGKECRALAK